jgi:hypothetical protein
VLGRVSLMVPIATLSYRVASAERRTCEGKIPVHNFRVTGVDEKFRSRSLYLRGEDHSALEPVILSAVYNI